MKKTMTLSYCMKIFAKYDKEMYEYLSGKKESALNMVEVSDYARDLRDDPAARP